MYVCLHVWRIFGHTCPYLPLTRGSSLLTSFLCTRLQRSTAPRKRQEVHYLESPKLPRNWTISKAKHPTPTQIESMKAQHNREEFARAFILSMGYFQYCIYKRSQVDFRYLFLLLYWDNEVLIHLHFWKFGLGLAVVAVFRILFADPWWMASVVVDVCTTNLQAARFSSTKI